MRILLVDDEAVSLKKLDTIMSQLGDTLPVLSGADAIEAFKQAWADWRPFDLLCLDVSMPEVDGTEVLYEVRRLEKEKSVEEDKRIKILMVTSHSDRDTVMTCVQAGCDGYIFKPFNFTTLMDKLESIGLA